MADTIQFELVTPEKRLVSKPVEMAVLPGSEGDLGILPGHAPVITSLRPGVIAIYEGDKIVDSIFAAGGFVEVRPDRLIVLAEQAQPVSSLNRSEAEQQVRDLAEDLADSKDDIERGHITTALAVAEARLAAVSVA